MTIKRYIKTLIFFYFIFIGNGYTQNTNKYEIKTLLDSISILQETNPQKALDYSFKANEKAKIDKNNIYISQSYYYIGKIYRILGDLINAEKNLDLALDIKIDSLELTADYNNEKGIILKQQSRFDEALHYYNMNLTLYKLNIKGRSRTYNNIGRIYEAMETYPKAKMYYNKALDVYKNMPIGRSYAITIHNIANVYKATENLDSAIYLYKKALKIYKKDNNKILIAYAYNSIASVIPDKNLAIKYLNKSIEIDKELNADIELGQTYVQLANIYLKDKQYQKAIPLLENGINLFSLSHHKIITRNALKSLFICYKSIGDYKKSLKYQSLFYQYQDSIKSDNNNYAILKYEAKIKLKDKEKEIAIQQIKLNSNKEKIEIDKQQKYYLSLGIGLLLILLAIVIFQVFKQKKNNRILNFQKLQIENRDKEKTLLIREIHHRVKNNLQIINSLLKIEQRKTENVETKQALSYAKERIEGISLIHEKLYQQADITNIDIENYLLDIAENLLFSFDKQDDIEIKINAKTINVFTDEAVNIGLLTAELITNSIKHGYNNSKDFKININIESNDNYAVYKYFDTGEKLIETKNITQSESFGIKLILSIIKKLNGELIIETNIKTGFNISFKFKLKSND